MQPGSRIANVGSRSQRGPSLDPGYGKRPPDRLGDHVKAQEIGVRTVGSETLDLRVDDLGVDLPDHVVAESQALDAPRRHVLDHDIRLHDQLSHYFLAALRLEVTH